MYPVHRQVNYWKQSKGSSGFDSMFRNGMSKKETFQGRSWSRRCCAIIHVEQLYNEFVTYFNEVVLSHVK